jgi:hypothetical protein
MPDPYPLIRRHRRKDASHPFPEDVIGVPRSPGWLPQPFEHKRVSGVIGIVRTVAAVAVVWHADALVADD